MEDFENKTERVQLLMTPSEVKTIDDWGFENRIRTRAEAIRRLCRMGLVHDNQIIKLLVPISDAQRKIADFKRNEQEAESTVALEFADAISADLNAIFGRLVVLALGNDSFKEATTEIALEATYQRLINHMPEMEDAYKSAMADAVNRLKTEVDN